MVAPACRAPGSASQAWCPAAASSRGSAHGRDSTALAVVPVEQVQKIATQLAVGRLLIPCRV